MAILFSDNFTGTTIDTGKWTETDPGGVIAQNNVLIITNTHAGTINRFTNKLESVASISSGVAVAQQLLTWSDDSVAESFGGIFLWKDNSNYAYLGSGGLGGKFRAIVQSGGSQVYSFESSIAKNTDIKIWTDGTTIKFYYWSGSAWTQIGTTQTYSLGYSLKYVITNQDGTGFNAGDTITIDNAYFSDADYATQYPLSSGPANLKSYNTNLKANIKSINTNLIANVKSLNTIT